MQTGERYNIGAGSELGKEMVKGLVSIIVAAYNHQQYISPLLESILEQTYTNMEVLICDDCSKDMTYQKAQEYVERFRDKGVKMRLMRNEQNQGVCKTFNRLLKLCEGEYIKPIASDDFFSEAEAIEEYVSLMEKFPQTDVLVANAYMVKNVASYPLNEEDILKPFYRTLPLDNEMDSVYKMYQENYICAPSVMYRRRVIETIGIYDESMLFEDWDYNLRIVEAGLEVRFEEACLVAYRQVGESLSHNVTEGGYIRQFSGQMLTLIKHAECVKEEAYQVQKAILFHYYTIAHRKKYRELATSVKKMMRKQKVHLCEWYYTYIKTEILVKMRWFKERK